MLNVLGIDPRARLQELLSGPAKVAEPAEAGQVGQKLSQLSQLSQGCSPETEKSQASAICPLARHPDDFEERAAIVEHEAEVPREWAEGFAHLNFTTPHESYSASRWLQLVDDAGRFLDRWAGQAAALGWTTPEVFGVDPRAPESRHDRKGLVPLICGAEVVAITADTVRLRVGNSVQTYYRHPNQHSIALWTLETRNAD